MSDIWDNIPTRSNANTDDVDAGWWNIFKTYLKIAFPGLNVAIGDDAFTIANNQTTYQNITDFTLDESTFTYYKWRYRIQRTDDGPEYRDEVGTIVAKYDGSDWGFTRSIEYGNALGDGIEGGDYGDNYYNVTTGGEVQYKSSNMTGGNHVATHEYKITEVWNA